MYFLADQQKTTTGIDSGKKALENAANQVYNVLRWNVYKHITVVNKNCTAYVKLGQYEADFVWDSRFVCNDFIGESARDKSREGAIKNAIRDYLTKSGQMGLLTDEELDSLV